MPYVTANGIGRHMSVPRAVRPCFCSSKVSGAIQNAAAYRAGRGDWPGDAEVMAIVCLWAAARRRLSCRSTRFRQSIACFIVS
jgi:hypothetical protein